MAHRSMVMVKRTYLHLAIVTMVTAVVWLFVSIYQSLTEPAKISVDPAIKTPLSAKLDQEVLDNILARDDLSELSFEPPSATESAITINEIAPAEAESAPTQSESPSEVTSEASQSAETTLATPTPSPLIDTTSE